MKASEFIEHLQQMIQEYGDLPLAVLEANDCNEYSFIEVDGVEGVYHLADGDRLYNKDDQVVKYSSSVFLID